MESTFIFSAIVIFVMIALRVLEIKFQRAIILAHLSWPMEKRLRVHFRKIPAFISIIATYFDGIKSSVRLKAAAKISDLREGIAQYFAELQESLRGKRALSRGSVSFFLLNISDYGSNRNREAVTVPVEAEERTEMLDIEEGI